MALCGFQILIFPPDNINLGALILHMGFLVVKVFLDMLTDCHHILSFIVTSLKHTQKCFS